MEVQDVFKRANEVIEEAKKLSTKQRKKLKTSQFCLN